MYLINIINQEIVGYLLLVCLSWIYSLCFVSVEPRSLPLQRAACVHSTTSTDGVGLNCSQWALPVLATGLLQLVSLDWKDHLKKKNVLDWRNKHLLFGRAFLPVSHIWWQLASCPSEGFLFVMGGEDENKTVLDSGEKYDPDSNTWCPIPTMLQVCPPVSRGVLLRTRHLVLTFVMTLSVLFEAGW